MQTNHRIKTNLSKDKVLNVQLQQDVDFLEILSLKIRQEDTYKLHSSNYGVIVGRVLANDAFGIPNAKVSVFIELEDADKSNSEIANLYPYTSITTNNSKGVRYNLLPDSSGDDCYKIVGTFPNKRLVLDDDSVLEVFDKYWKYTTVTNRAGDYMIFGVPTGTQQVHVDMDLSDIGILSQKPRDMIYKGYTISQFDNSNQFKESTNLDGLSQLYAQNESVHVYSFWGDNDVNEIAITRCDVQIQYKFEPTCVFMGSVMTDNFANNIGHNCSPSTYSGFNRDMVTAEGTIEMIRKTIDGLVEEFQIQGNRLINGNGVWCYQIPMNLDYVGTDEYGNIIPTDNPKKGIPTKASVRFRLSVQETPSDEVSRHRAKYLIPNNPDLVEGSMIPQIPNGKTFDNYYEFGTATPDNCYRDIYWNKVYGVKNYIPRLQNNSKESAQNYNALRTCNISNANNPIPFNRMRYRLVFGYRLLCMIMTVVVWIICGINALLSGLQCICLPWPIKLCIFKPITPNCIRFSVGVSEDEDSTVEYFPCCAKCGKMECDTRGCTKNNDANDLIDSVQQQLSREYDVVNLDFYNDWLNGSLYAPLWYWKKAKKKTFFFGLFSKRAINSYCGCKYNFNRLRVIMPCSFKYADKNLTFNDGDGHTKWHREVAPNLYTNQGVIKEVENRDGLMIYYYSPGVPTDFNYRSSINPVNYVRLFSTDLILLGSLNSCDLDSYPQPFLNMPTTSVNVPFIVTIQQSEPENNSGWLDGAVTENGLIEVTGMDWGHEGKKANPTFGTGLLFDLSCDKVATRPKSCVNIERMCELGVSLDIFYQNTVARNGNIKLNNMRADGMITRYELVDANTRSMFASLNHYGLTKKVINKNTGYDTYKLRYMYPTDFDGRMSSYSENYTSKSEFKTYDTKDMTYINYRMGPGERHFYFPNNGFQFPLYNNSFYFYFGLHEGNTAIDKFNEQFFSSCYKNTKYPFLLSIEKIPGKWCIKNNNPNVFETDYGNIKVTIDNIKTPYSYSLSDEYDNVLIDENSMYNNDLMFGVAIKNGGGEYLKNADGTYKLDGRLRYFNNGSLVQPQQLLTNKLYKLTITDVKGQSITQLIDIVQNSITMTYFTYGLGTKYYPEGESVIGDICNDNNFYGNIVIRNIIIDGLEYIIPDGGVSSIGNGNFKIKCQRGTDSYDVLLEITPVLDGVKFQDCVCNNSTSIPTYVINSVKGNESLTFNIWIPNDYNIRITQYCNGELNDNMSNIIVNVANGALFEMFFNAVPLRVIMGKNEDINLYNKNFYNPNAKEPVDLKGWFGLHKENTYQFMGIEKKYHEVWDSYVGYIETEGEGNNEVMTEDSKLDVINYKFESMFLLSNSAYITEISESIFAITHKGGKNPILYRGVYPRYDAFEGSETIVTPLQEYIADSLGYTTCKKEFPNIVGFNYGQNNIDGTVTTIKPNIKAPYFNPLFDDAADLKKLGNYFAMFTQNGGIIPTANESCKIDASVKTQQIPNKANLLFTIGGINCPASVHELQDIPNLVIDKKGINNPYFRAEFVDRRMDYDFFIITPYSGAELQMYDDGSSTVNSGYWKLARFSGSCINGIEMAYKRTDSNIISPKASDGLEYYYNKDIAMTYYNDTATAKLNRKYYKVVLRANGQNSDLRDFFWSNDKNPAMLNLNTDPTKGIYYFNHAADTGLFNGEFDVNNYPIKRLIDIGNVPSSDKMTFSGSSCSYRVRLEEDGEANISGIMESGETSTFDIDCRSMITVKVSNLDEYINNNVCNVLYISDSGGGQSLLFKSYILTLNFSVKEDAYNTTHLIQTKLPKIIKVKRKDTNENIIDRMKKTNSIGNIENIMYSQTLDVGFIGEGVQLGDDGYFYDTEWSKVYDDSQDFKKIAFIPASKLIKINSKVWGNGTIGNFNFYAGTDINDIDVFSILIERRYFNSNRDNLSKFIRAIEFGSLYDCKQFTIKVNKIEEVELTPEPPPTPPESAITFDEGEEPPVTELVMTQITYFDIPVDDNTTSVFSNPDAVIAFAAKFTVKNETYIKNDIESEVMLDGNGKVTNIIIKIKWNGNMSNMFLSKLGEVTLQLFAKVPNGLIYGFAFKINKDKNIYRDSF